MKNAPLPLSLYIHMPWCIKKCPYCDFNSHQVEKGELPEEKYINALMADFDRDVSYACGRPIQSIFIGGGTPSLFKAESYDRLFQHIKKQLRFKKNIEITLEANPGAIDKARFKDYLACGINRLSIGVQSFNDQHLKKLGRIHDAKAAKDAIDKAKTVGFSNFNIDLMHGLVKQTVQEANEDLLTALSFKPPHLSWYQLTIEPNTIFYKERPNLPDEDKLFDIEQGGFSLLEAYTHYEVSAFAKRSHQCEHNLNYWRFGDYLGIGAGAHSKLTDVNKQQVFRLQKKRMPQDYLQQNFIAKEKMLTANDLIFEYMLNVLRLNEPVHFTAFKKHTFLTEKSIAAPLAKAVQLGLIDLGKKCFCITPHGRRYLNNLQQLFLN